MRIAWFFVFTFLSLALAAQQSLVLNGDFEDENICFEYQVNCAPEAWISSADGFNNYFKDAHRAFHGEHCMAVEAGHSYKPFERTYIRTQLVCAMRPGARYLVKMMVKSYHPVIDSIGIAFPTTDPLLERLKLEKMEPALWLGDAGRMFATDSSWQEVNMVYTATGQEKYMMIGNFSRADVSGGTGLNLENHFFVFLDQVSLLPEDPLERLCSDYGAQRDAIYAQDDRHEYMRRRLRSGREWPLPQLESTRKLVARTITLPDVLFESGKAVLQPASGRLLDSICRSLENRQVDSLIIEGHTDNRGSDQLNDTLSKARAMAVWEKIHECRYLQRRAIIVRGRGARKPVADNSSEAGRRKNRRVELVFYTLE